jgi:small subunit ribosomal protein S18
MVCYFCQKNINTVDYKNTELLSRFISGFYKIKSSKKTGLCTHHQRMIATAIKRSRQMGMLPYTPK